MPRQPHAIRRVTAVCRVHPSFPMPSVRSLASTTAARTAALVALCALGPAASAQPRKVASYEAPPLVQSLDIDASTGRLFLLQATTTGALLGVRHQPRAAWRSDAPSSAFDTFAQTRPDGSAWGSGMGPNLLAVSDDGLVVLYDALRRHLNAYASDGTHRFTARAAGTPDTLSLASAPTSMRARGAWGDGTLRLYTVPGDGRSVRVIAPAGPADSAFTDTELLNLGVERMAFAEAQATATGDTVYASIASIIPGAPALSIRRYVRGFRTFERDTGWTRTTGTGRARGLDVSRTGRALVVLLASGDSPPDTPYTASVVSFDTAPGGGSSSIGVDDVWRDRTRGEGFLALDGDDGATVAALNDYQTRPRSTAHVVTNVVPVAVEALAPIPGTLAVAVHGRRVRVTTSAAQEVTVEAFDVLGRRVSTLVSGWLDVGDSRETALDGLAPGIYVVRARGATGQATARAVVR